MNGYKNGQLLKCDRGNLTTLRRTCPSTTLPTTNSTWTALEEGLFFFLVMVVVGVLVIVISD